MNSIRLRINKLEKLSGFQRIVVVCNEAEVEALIKQDGNCQEDESIIWVMTGIESPPSY